jgi:hypothetical protein
MAKPSEKYSVVPTFLRDKFREYKKKERMEDKTDGESAKAEGPSEQDREALRSLIESDGASTGPTGGQMSGGQMTTGNTETKGYKKGGMVRKPRSGRGDGCAVKGFTKGRMY